MGFLFREAVIQGPDDNGHITWVSRDDWLVTLVSHTVQAIADRAPQTLTEYLHMNPQIPY
jgi:hypothetical protein